jgi:hypothetical protein
MNDAVGGHIDYRRHEAAHYIEDHPIPGASFRLTAGFQATAHGFVAHLPKLNLVLLLTI